MNVVKIYRETENIGLLTDENQLKDYQRLVAELGMAEVKENKTPNIYTAMNDAHTKCLEALCPMKTEYKNYNKSTIPVEVLECLAFVVKNEMFDMIEVWCDDTQPDPLLIGKKYRSENDREKKYSWLMHHTLIARWGDCAHEFEVLLQMGRERILKRMTNEAIEIKQKVNAFLEFPDVHVDRFLQS